MVEFEASCYIEDGDLVCPKGHVVEHISEWKYVRYDFEVVDDTRPIHIDSDAEVVWDSEMSSAYIDGESKSRVGVCALCVACHCCYNVPTSMVEWS